MSTIEVLTQVLKPGLVPKVQEWEASSSANERKGLKIIGSIFKYKGKKVFRNVTGSGSRMQTAEAQLKKRQMVSTYDQEYSGVNKGIRGPSIFDYKRLEDMPCSSVLNTVAVMFIQNWIDLKDDPAYQELVLQCLRSIQSVINSSSGLISESHKHYQWNDPSKNYTAHKIDHQASGILGVRSTSANAPWTRPKPAEKPEAPIKSVMFTKEDLLKQRQALIQGSGIIGKWVVAPANPHVSSYQETYVTHFNKYQKILPPDFQTSISVGRLCPNIQK